MTVRDRKAVEWEAGHRFGSLRFGPISKEAVLSMAELTGDFHPFRLVDRAAGEAGYVGLVLHPMWISALADAVIRRAFPGCRITYLSLVHHQSALDTSRLTVELTCQEHDTHLSHVKVKFTVSTHQDVVVADGKACVVPMTPQLVRTCST